MRLEAVVIAGFTGRDQEAVAAHVDELRALGVPTPSSLPSHYLAPPSVLVQNDLLVAVQPETSGEVECVVIVTPRDVLLTVGSDHTDRAAESVDIGLSKLLCPKPIAPIAWRFDDLGALRDVDHFELRSWVTIGGVESLYQEGTLADFLPLPDIVEGVPFRRQPGSFAVFAGTLGAIGGIRPAERFRASVLDPRAGREITFEYRIEHLDVLEVAAGDVPVAGTPGRHA